MATMSTQLLVSCLYIDIDVCVCVCVYQYVNNFKVFLLLIDTKFLSEYQPQFPGGLLYVREWNNLQYVTSASFLLAVYSDYLSAANAKLNCPEGQIQPQELLNFAKSQADYILGKNPKAMSYIVGYGARYPVHVHHRDASIPSISVVRAVVGCVQGFETWYHRTEGNPNVIYGALVGGPDQNDNFSDDRSNYEGTEPTISGAGPLVGLFSKLQSLNGGRIFIPHA